MDDAAAVAQVIPIEVDLERAAQKVQADFSKVETKIHRLPASLRDVSRDGCYTVPRAVSIGPYHHGARHLRAMEDVKRAAAYHFCRGSGRSPEAIYGELLSVSSRARGLLEALMAVTSVPVPVGEFINRAAASFEIFCDAKKNGGGPSVLDGSYRPPHLLGLVREYLSGSMAPPDSALDHSGVISFSQSSSAIELAEIGIKLTTSRTTQLRDMGIRKALFGGELFLAPLVLDGLNAC
ncbi:hypothetical protein BAE44_0024116 [Dichanthelium oligosanthes]|uniref:Uncharacterized protein n=1 Tax=Dichanthelium oligosanthes TaxID=888268 RepID=A0A1E5UPT5_9POAL|nr:hypothetical protein BAE44_0024116 [Dichanthelium oligosanthes]